MVTRTSKLFDVGTLPELGTLPEKMHAWTLRNERLEIRRLHSEKRSFPCLNQVMTRSSSRIFYAGVNHNGIWAALGKPKT